jgi:hypothetical protein
MGRWSVERSARVAHFKGMMNRPAVILLPVLALLSGCSPHLPPASDLVAMMPESTRAVLVAQSPKTGPDGELGLFDESAIAAHMGMVELLDRFGAFCATFPLDANGDEDWHAVGITTGLGVAIDGPKRLQNTKLVFVTRSKKPIDGPSGDWASMLASSELERVEGVEGVAVYLAKDRPSDNAPPDRRGAYIALIDHTLVIASLELEPVMEVIRRAHSKHPQIPRALRRIAGTVPEGVGSYLLTTHQTERGGVRFSAVGQEVQLAATALSICRAPSDELAYRYCVISTHRQSDLHRLANALRVCDTVQGEADALATLRWGGSADAQWIEDQYDVSKVRASMAGEGILMGLSYAYQQTLMDTGAIDFEDDDDHPSPESTQRRPE